MQQAMLNRINAHVVRQHAEESAHLWSVRDRLLRAARVTVSDLAAHDQRIAAHVDGVALAGEAGWQLCDELLENVGAGEMFSATVRALDDRRAKRVAQMLAIAATAGDLWRGVVSAFGWVSDDRLQGIVGTLVASDDPSSRLVGVTACALHRVDPGLIRRNQFADRSPSVRARAFRTAGEIGCAELAGALLGALSSPDAEGRFWASWSAVLCGSRGTAADLLAETGLVPGPRRARAFRLALQAMNLAAARDYLRARAKRPDQLRWLIQGTGLTGDPAYVPWLIGHMHSPATARLAGEAFTMITGADLTAAALEGDLPQLFDAGPTDDPNDPNVEADPDEGLPWPDPKKIDSWWEANRRRLPSGTRYLLGQSVTRAHCIDVLRSGYQRQRILAAHHLTLLDPGTPLFNTSAPAWRQQRLLAQMK